MHTPRLAAALLALVLVPLAASAQTVITVGPVLLTDKVTIDALSNATAAEAQALVYKLTVDGAAPLTLGATVCTGAPYTCAISLTQPAVDALNRLGQHSSTLTATHATGGESAPSVPFSLRTPPAAPAVPRVTR